MRILIVDDESCIVDEVCDFLRRRGHEPVPAGSVEEAARTLDTAPPFDVVLTDMKMPQGSGLDVLRACNRTRPPRPTTLLMTGQSDDGDVERATAEGALSVLWKPLSLRRIVEALALVERYRAAD
ncbi:response regulator [Vineibacter terrae]|nr:response regulator [Vineibacter terrae]